VEECLSRKLITSNGFSNKGAPILYKEHPPLNSRTPLGRVLLIERIHGDEYSSASIVFKWMRALDKYHYGLFHWHISSLINSDGLLRPKS